VTPRRRGTLLAGLALALGGLAASDVAGREAKLRRELGPSVPVVVAAHALARGHAVRAADLAVRHVPARFAPAGAVGDTIEVTGLRLAAALPAGADVTSAIVTSAPAAEAGAPVRSGERVVDLVAVGSASTIHVGGRVDVLVTREGGDGAAGRTELALQDVEVLAVRGVSAGAGERAGERVQATLRVTLRQAVYLAAAQSFARELRLLPRAAGDRAHARRGLVVADTLEAPQPP
jgi:pilus assembly protein CpaB